MLNISKRHGRKVRSRSHDDAAQLSWLMRKTETNNDFYYYYNPCANVDISIRQYIDLPVLGTFLIYFFSLHIFFHIIYPPDNNYCPISKGAITIGSIFLAFYTLSHHMATVYIEIVKMVLCKRNAQAVQLIILFRRVRIACFVSSAVVLGTISLMKTIIIGQHRFSPSNGGCVDKTAHNLPLFINIFISPQIDLWWNIVFAWTLNRRANINLFNDERLGCELYTLGMAAGFCITYIWGLSAFWL